MNSTMQSQANELPVTIERAVPGDAATICDIRDQAWIAAYPNPELGITAEDIKVNAQGLHGEFVPRRIAYLQKEIAAEDGINQVTFVAKVDGKVVGYVAPRHDADGHRMISMIYVLPEYQGKGIGSKLLQRALDWFGHDQDIFLEVVSYNQSAIHFYEKFGFEKTNNVPEEETGRPSYMKSIPQIEMVLRATAE